MMRGNFLIQEHSHTLLYEEGERIQDTGDDIVIVIDPGHGGENLGAETGKIYEKYMTMATAEAMRDRLSGYDGVTVYMTREEDIDISLADRAEFASSVSADYLFSIHYNASADHNAWGTEIWVPLEPPYNAYGFQFGSVWLSEMERFGVFSRGVKTRTGKAGNYYGILRHCTKKGIPSAILEHCYVDTEGGMCDDASEYKAMGEADAEAVAVYLGLEEGPDIPAAEADKQVASTLNMKTDPEICEIVDVNADYDNCELSFNINASDSDAVLSYYQYSMDGGASWTSWMAWPERNIYTLQAAPLVQVNCKVPEGMTPTLVARAYNNFDVYTESTPVYLNTFGKWTEQASVPVNSDEKDETSDEISGEELQCSTVSEDAGKQDRQSGRTAGYFILFGGLISLVVLICCIRGMLKDRNGRK